MKTLSILLLILCLATAVRAQFDNQFYYPQKAWQECSLPNSEDIYFYPEQDTLHSVLCKPSGTPVATIFYIHGNSGNISANASRVDTLVKAGFQVFIADFRGFGKSSGVPTHKNIAADGQMILDYLLERPGIKGTKFLVYGASIGTQLATKLAKDNQPQIDGLILEGGFSSFTDMALPFIPEEKREFVKPYLIFPYSSGKDIQATGHMPKLIMHSREDEVVPYEQGEQVFSNAPEPKVFLELQGKHLAGLINEPGLIISHINQLIGNH